MATTLKPITCRAAVTWEICQPFVIETVEVAAPRAGEVRVKMGSTGVCHSDRHIRDGSDPNTIYPIVLGHEGAGVIESVGPGVTSVVPGDVVVLVFEAYCGECELCKSPNTNLCLKQSRNGFPLDGSCRITCKGQKLSQLGCLGTFSEYTTVLEIQVAKVNPLVSPSRLGLAGCCIPTGYGSAVKCAQVEPGSTCAVWGLGGVGMNVVLGCKASKASKIIGIDTNNKKFPLAKEFGCTDFVNPKEVKGSVIEELKSMTGGNGVDYCFVSVGYIPAMEEAFNSSHQHWGQTIIVGLSNAGETMRVGIMELLFGRKVKGTYYGSYKARLEIPKLVEKIVDGEIPLDKLITHVIPLDDINHGFEMLNTGESLRAIIDLDVQKV